MHKPIEFSELRSITKISLKMLLTLYPSQKKNIAELLVMLDGEGTQARHIPRSLKRIHASIAQESNSEAISMRMTTTTILKEIKKLRSTPHLSAEQINVLASLPTSEKLNINDVVIEVIDALKLFTSEMASYRELNSDTDNCTQKTTAQSIKPNDITCSSKRIIKCFLPMLKKLQSEFPTDSKLAELALKSDNAAKSTELDFYEIINLLEECTRYIAVLQSKRSDAEAVFLQTFNAHLKSMHAVIDKSSKANQGFLLDSDKSKEGLNRTIQNFHDAAENENDPEKLKRLIKSNIESMKMGVVALIAEQHSHITKQQEVIDALGRQVKKQEQQIEAIFKKKTLLKNTLESARVMSSTDALTGILNRGAYDRFMGQLNEGGSKTTSLIVMDIDKFKSLNDLFGHQAGDKALIAVSRLIKQRLEKISAFDGDVFRYGGEEFVVVCKNVGVKKAEAIAEHLRSLIAQQQYKLKDKPLNITASFGVASTEQEGTYLSNLFECADSAMYQAKTNGRNRVCTNNTPSSTSA